MVCFPSSISRERLVDGRHPVQVGAADGNVLHPGKEFFSLVSLVEKIPLLRTNEFADWIP